MKTIVLNSCFLLISLLAFNQKPSVQLIVESEEVGVNQPFTITLKSNIEGEVVENWPSNFVQGYGVSTSSSYIQDYNTGKLQQEHVFVYSGSFNKPGKYKLGPFYVKSGNKTKNSNTITITVSTSPVQSNNPEDISRKQLRQPAFGVIEVSSTKIYEGEPLVVLGRVYSKERTFGRPVLRRSFSFDGVTDMFPLQQNETWENLVIKKVNYESFAFEKQVLFPVGSGVINIQPFEVYLPYGMQGFNVVSSVPTVQILPLPANPPAGFIGAVGEFEVEQKYKDKQVKQGDIVQVDVVISGKGNLHSIETPVLPLPKGMSTYGDAEIKEDYVFGPQGAVGKVTYTYHIQVTKDGDQTIQPIKIAYFSPKDEKYISVTAKKPTVIKVSENSKFQLDDETDSLNVSDQSADSKNLKKGQKLFSTDNYWLIYGGGALLCVLASLLFIVFRKKQPEKEKDIASKKVVVKAVTPAEVNELLGQTKFYFKEKEGEKFFASFEKTVIALMKLQQKQPMDSTLSRGELVANLPQNEDSSTIKRLLEKCDYARYGMISSEEEQAVLLVELEKLVK